MSSSGKIRRSIFCLAGGFVKAHAMRGRPQAAASLAIEARAVPADGRAQPRRCARGIRARASPPLA